MMMKPRRRAAAKGSESPRDLSIEQFCEDDRNDEESLRLHGNSNHHKSPQNTSCTSKTMPEFIAAILMIGMMMLAVAFVIFKQGHNSDSDLVPVNDEYILWSRKETYFSECRGSFLYNDTWGKERAPFVDKVGVKNLLRQWQEEDESIKITGLKIPPTLAVFDKTNSSKFTLDALRAIPQPYIIKTSHGSGGIARVNNNTYQCVKECPPKTEKIMPLGNKAFAEAHKLHIRKNLLNGKHARDNREPQYQFVHPSIIIEKDILTGNKDIQRDVTYWYVADGVPIFVSQQCELNGQDGQLGTLSSSRAFFSARFQRLPMKLKKPVCTDVLEKPHTWDRQRSIVESIGARLSKGIVRIDLYAGDEDIYFSEATFTTSQCKLAFHPAVADGLLFAAVHGVVHRDDASRSAYIEEVIGGSSWGFVELQRGKQLHPSSASTFPSPLDLCEDYSSHEDSFKSCIQAAREASSYPVRCLVADPSNDNTISSFGVERYPTIQKVSERLVWDRIFVIVGIIFVMSYYQVGTRTVGIRQIILVNIAFAIAATYSDVFFHHDGKWFSHLNTINIVEESFIAFRNVHPVENVAVATAHFATYWMHAASWFSKSPRRVLVWALLTEVVVTFVNEWSHHNEWQTDVRCMRVAFIDGMKGHGYDELWREFFLGPIFVYFYLLPKFVVHWSRVFFSG
jgi:hypothetical protein